MRRQTSWSIEADYIDAHGQPKTAAPEIVERLRQALALDNSNSAHVLVLRGARATTIALPHRHDGAWDIADGERVLMSGHAEADRIEIPAHLPSGHYRLRLSGGEGSSQTMVLLASPEAAYQPPVFESGARLWILAVQLYAVRSAENWGHGDFGDLKALLRIAAKSGAAGVGLNPLHALAPGQASPYSPSSRVFLNPLYIDLAGVPDFPGIEACGLSQEIERLRDAAFIDYPAIHTVKLRALRACFSSFATSASPQRRAAFERFCADAGDLLRDFAAFESRRERFGARSRDWPKGGRHEDGAEGSDAESAFHQYLQWIAADQLAACATLAKSLGLPIGLYLDVAVGVDSGGADSWSAGKSLACTVGIGAPPDVYNPAGQNWGIVSFHPQALIESNFGAFREMLRAVMRSAGAIRLDHALGLYRLYMIPAGCTAADGAYVHFPFEAMLAVVAQESVACRCLVIGEDLGTMPEGIGAALNSWGVWSYRVGLFERDSHDLFRHPDRFPDQSIVTFNTHDLPTFAGWKSGHDLAARHALGIDPGESATEREQSIQAMRNTLAQQSLPPDLSFVDAVRYLARANSRLLAVSIEDIMGLLDQHNIPGTVDEYPNWRRRLPLGLDDIASHPALAEIAGALAAEGRGVKS